MLAPVSFMYILLLTFSIGFIQAQPSSAHLVYDIISHTIYDSTKISSSDIADMEEVLDKLNADVYYNPSWVIIKKRFDSSSSLRMYDRKQKLVYLYLNERDSMVVKVDSLMHWRKKDRVKTNYITLANSNLKVEQQLKVKRQIDEWKVYRMIAASAISPTADDTIWKTNFLDVPNLLYPEYQYFLNKGWPIEFTYDFDGVLFTVGVVSIKTLEPDDPIFNKPEGTYKEEHFDSADIIKEIAENQLDTSPDLIPVLTNFYLAYRVQN